MKTSRQLERHFKGVANHWRLDILLLIRKSDEITLDEICQTLGSAAMPTISEHTRRLVHAGLIQKTYSGRNVCHTLTPYGKKMVAFIQTFQHY